MNFEEKLKNLESIVDKMESGQMKLDDMIVAFNEGRKLVDDCRKDLDSIRAKVEKVTANGVEAIGLAPDGDLLT